MLQTLHLPLAMRAESAVRVVLTGGTFNPKAPPYPFLEQTWRGYLAAFGMPIALAMPAAGFYPRGGGQLDAWIEPATPQAWILDRSRPARGGSAASPASPISATTSPCGCATGPLQRLADEGLDADLEIEIARWPSPGQGAALEPDRRSRRRDPRHVRRPGRARQAGRGGRRRGRGRSSSPSRPSPPARSIRTPPTRSSCPWPWRRAGRSTPSREVTEHLRTNAATIRAFLDRPIAIEEPGEDGRPGRVVVG